MIFRGLLIAWAIVAQAGAQDVARMTRLVEARADGDRFMGSVLVTRAGRTVFERSVGFADAEWHVPNSADTRFRIGSITKQFTAAAVLLLQEEGKLQLSDPVSRHVPGAPASWHDITLYQLLTHTAGLPSVTELPEYPQRKLSPATPLQIVDLIRELPLDFPPGEKFHYSNSGYIVLGAVIEQASGRSYETFLRERVLQPLGLENTGVDRNDAILPRRAAGYAHDAQGQLIHAPYIDMSLPHAAGSFYSSTHDLARWCDSLFGGKLLSPASLEKMISPHLSDYALGLGVKTEGGRRVIQHGGGIEGFNSYLAFYPDPQLVVVVLANVNGPAAAELAGELAAVALGDPAAFPAERPVAVLPSSGLAGYVGVYRLTDKVTIAVRQRDDHLTVQLSGQAEFPLFPESGTKFFLKVVDAQIEFSRDANGRVAQLTLHQNGHAQVAPRISDRVVERREIELPRPAKEALLGVYQLRPGLALTIALEGDQLTSQATGQAKAPIFPESDTRFFFKVVDAQLEFFTDAEGRVTHLVLHQGPMDVTAPRR
ncbi:MAG TPA: serine hydrolase [Opitutus sp.]|nr:serine hydrolase [Opitutus sp.]